MSDFVIPNKKLSQKVKSILLGNPIFAKHIPPLKHQWAWDNSEVGFASFADIMRSLK